MFSSFERPIIGKIRRDAGGVELVERVTADLHRRLGSASRTGLRDDA